VTSATVAKSPTCRNTVASIECDVHAMSAKYRMLASTPISSPPRMGRVTAASTITST
jgi:hypothetical protein